MNVDHRRGVTRGYVGGLLFAVVVIAVSLLIASWGLLALALDGGPVRTPDIERWVAAVIVLLALGVLAWGLWLQSLTLLRGLRTPPWGHVLALGVGGYLTWCLGGLLAGLSIEETWLSPFSLVLGVVWSLCSLLCWAVLVRRVYTDRPTPQWPWERRGEPGPDWAISGDDPWRDDPGGTDGPESADDPDPRDR